MDQIPHRGQDKYKKAREEKNNQSFGEIGKKNLPFKKVHVVAVWEDMRTFSVKALRCMGKKHTSQRLTIDLLTATAIM